jgi:hypothetical protein
MSRFEAGMVSLVAAIAATAGDLLLLAASNAGRPGFEWLPAPSEPALWIGTYLGVLAIPCYGLGYREVARRLSAPHRSTVAALAATRPITPVPDREAMLEDSNLPQKFLDAYDAI